MLRLLQLALTDKLVLLFKAYETETKKIHLVMFIIMQLCYSSIIVAYVFLVNDRVRLYAVFGDTYWAFATAAHSIFALKFWILARKL